MRLAILLVLLPVVAVAAFYGAIIAASESGEVVTLRTSDAEGHVHPTRLWVVDYDGQEWVRTGHPEKGWFLRILANPQVELRRGKDGGARVARPVRDPAVAARVNEAFARKYGAADWIVALSGDAAKRVPVRLDPR